MIVLRSGIKFAAQKPKLTAEKMKLLKATLLALTNADLYLHMPRGSNNRLNENSQNRANNNRLFDSQNNNKERDRRFHFFSLKNFVLHFWALIQCHESPFYIIEHFYYTSLLATNCSSLEL